MTKPKYPRTIPEGELTETLKEILTTKEAREELARCIASPIRGHAPSPFVEASKKKQYLVTLTVDVLDDEDEDVVLSRCAKAIERSAGYVAWQVGIEEIEGE